MKKKVYVHYGHSKFDPNIFNKILNDRFTKPSGGLWASEIEDVFSWKDWCIENDFRECDEDNSFKFTLKDNTNILNINSINDLDNLPKRHEGILSSPTWTLLDFEKLLSLGYDAIKYNISNDGRLYFALYGWDCDSILIMNKDCIAPI